jgi:hypothetical protein
MPGFAVRKNSQSNQFFPFPRLDIGTEKSKQKKRNVWFVKKQLFDSIWNNGLPMMVDIDVASLIVNAIHVFAHTVREQKVDR